MATPVYCVTGFHRSGTSMMMQCLRAGGLAVVGEADPHGLNARYGRPGYLPNPHGFYQDGGRPDAPGWYAARRGKAVKVRWYDWPRVPPGEYRVAFLLRDPAEIAASVRAFVGGEAAEVLAGGNGAVIADYARTIGGVLAALALRSGVRVTPLRYADVVADPVPHLTRLAADGWPADPAAAAAAVDPALYRHRGAGDGV